MRSWPLALGSLLVAALYACGSDSTESPTPVDDAGSGCTPDSTQPCTCDDGRASTRTCGPEGSYRACACPSTPIPDPEDAGQDVATDTCPPATPSSDEASDSCQLVGPCTDCNGGWKFRCPVAGGVRKQPSSLAGNPQLGCRRLTETTDTTDYCCTGECTRTKMDDGVCSSNMKAMVCSQQSQAVNLGGGSCDYHGEVVGRTGWFTCCL